MSHLIKLFETWNELSNGKRVARSAPLGSITIEHERNKERRKAAARARATAHVGRAPSSILHADGDTFVAVFRREVPNA